MKQPIYLDYQATTPMAPEVFDVMVPWLKDNFGNPHSAHTLGRQAAAAVEAAREQVGSLMPASGKVIFTGSATEAINIAFGCVQKLKDPTRNKIVILDTEHAAVRDTALSYEKTGFEVNLISVGTDGLVSFDALEQAIDQSTALVAVMLVNNEIGVIQSLEAITTLAHRQGAMLLCDAVQGFGRVPIPDNIDMAAISGHKVHGPKGIGALWVRDSIKFPTLIHGGGQEQGVRSGTLSPALCVGLGTAAVFCREHQAEDLKHVENLSDLAMDLFGNWTINGSEENRYRGNMNIQRDRLDVGRLISEVRGVAFSAGSACASGSGRPSHVLKAIGLDDAQTKSSIRLGFGRYTTEEEIKEAAHLINSAAEVQLS